jgi:hypothetical protein
MVNMYVLSSAFSFAKQHSKRTKGRKDEQEVAYVRLKTTTTPEALLSCLAHTSNQSEV